MLPLWWQLAFFGVTGLDPGGLDSSGNHTFLYDWLNGLDPSAIQFSIAVTNQFANSAGVPVQVNLLGGAPSYIAVLVNDTNAANANWQPFTSTNLWVSTPSDGAYVITVGLCGLATNATPDLGQRSRVSGTPRR